MNNQMRKMVRKLHLWLALPVGLTVFVVCITGAIYAFKDEVTALTEPWRFVEEQSKPQLQPSELLALGAREVGSDKRPKAITYGESTDAAWIDYQSFQAGDATTVFINPYDGQLLKTVQKKGDDFDFFRFLLKGHRSLWLPKKIGKPLVGWSVLLFGLTLLTGAFLWIPKRWRGVKHHFRIRKKQLNFDLHNTFGALFLPFLLLIACTGLIWSFTWFSKAVYGLTGGGELKPYVLPQSDSSHSCHASDQSVDQLYLRLKRAEPQAATFYIALPTDSLGVFRVSVVHKRNSYYQTDNLFFDQYTLRPLQGSGPYAGKYTEAALPDRIRRLNLELHDGRIGGLAGKVVASLSAGVGALLIVTGFTLYFRRMGRRSRSRN